MPNVCTHCRRAHDGSYWWADFCSRECRLEHDHPSRAESVDAAGPVPGATADRVCGGIDCRESLEGMRADAIFHSAACRMRTNRLAGIPADWPARSRRFWNGAKALMLAASANTARTRAAA